MQIIANFIVNLISSITKINIANLKEKCYYNYSLFLPYLNDKEVIYLKFPEQVRSF